MLKSVDLSRARFSPLALGFCLGLSLAIPTFASPDSAAEGPPEVTGPIVGPEVTPKLSPPARDLPPAPPPSGEEVNPLQGGPEAPPVVPVLPEVEAEEAEEAGAGIADPVAQLSDAGSFALDQLGNPIVNVTGQAGSNPNDTNGDVGPNDFVQMKNASFRIYDKQGAPRGAAAQINSLWTSINPGDTSECALQNLGDPIVLYDNLADRWLLSQFAKNISGSNSDPGFICIAISQTADPTGAYYLYQFQVSQFPDYFKIGAWPDGYYVSANLANPSVGLAVVFDRANMLNGNPAGAVEFTVPGQSGTSLDTLIPSDVDGMTNPPAGTPNFMYRPADTAVNGGAFDRLEVWEFSVNWITPASSTFTGPTNIPTAAFDSTTCGYVFPSACVPQPGTGQILDAIPFWGMYRFPYRNFGTHEVLAGNFTVDADGNNGVGIRWFILERSGGGAWSVANEGTYAPQPTGAPAFVHRWMGSVAMDQFGNLALGHSRSSAQDPDPNTAGSGNPSAYYTGRLASDPLGLLPQPEILIRQGQGFTTSDRWGDYFSMSVDPVDDCTFWYTGDSTNANGSRQSSIVSFRFADCAADLEISKSVEPFLVHAGNEVFYTVTVRNNGPIDTTNVEVVDVLPVGVTYLGDTDSCVEGPAGTLTCDLGDLAAGDTVSFTIKGLVDPDLVVAESDGTITITNTAFVSADHPDSDESNNEASVTSFVEDESDLAVVKVCKPDRELLAGQTGTCTVVVDNFGPSYARDVVVLDSMVSDGLFEVTSARVVDGANCAVTPNDSDPHDRFRVVCNVGNLEPAEVAASGRELIQVDVVALEQLDINDVSRAVSTMTPDPDISNNTSVGSLAVTALADLVLAKAGPATAAAGAPGDIVYTLTVQNNGPSTAVNVVLEDVVPAGTSIDSVNVTVGAGACNAGVPGDPFLPTTCDLGTMADSDTREVQIVATVLPDTPAGTILHNDGRVSSDTLDLENANNLDSADTTVVADADLEVVKSDSPDPVVAGDPLIYEVVVTNNGPSKAIDVAIVDLLPTEVTFVGTTVSNGSGTCVWLDAPSRVECDLNDLGPGASVTIFIDVIVNSDTPAGTITDNVSVSAATPDSNAGNDSDSEDTRVVTEADLEVLKDANFAAGNPSTEIIYTITVTNDGPSDAQNVMVVDTLPLSGTKKQSKVVFLFETSNGACTHDLATNVVTCECSASAPPPWCTLAAGESISFDILVDTKGNLGTITNNVVVSSDTTDPNGLNDEANKDMLIQGGTGNPGGPGGGRGR